MDPEELQREYEDRCAEIENRIEEFEELQDADDWRLFKELVFVILTSRSRAKKCWEATERLEELGMLKNGGREEIAEILESYGIQYERNKADYIVTNRENLSQPTLTDTSGDMKLRSRINPEDLEKTREELVEELNGVGWKAASHFLRNIGYGDEFAIVSGYISKKLYQLGLLESPQAPADREDYLDAERKIKQVSEETGIGVKELDLLLWSMETGEVFK